MRSWEQVLWKGVMVGLSSGLLAGCANPHLIESVKETGDWDLDCGQLKKEILLVDTYRKEADAEQGTTGTNFMAYQCSCRAFGHCAGRKMICAPFNI